MQSKAESINNYTITKRNSTSPIKIIIATIVKDIQISKRYIPNLFGMIIQIVLRIMFFLFLSGIVSYKGSHYLEGKSLFLFFASSFLLFIFFSTAIWTPLNTINTDLYNGTLEYLYVNPSSRYAYFTGTVITSAIINMIFFIPIFLFIAFYSGALLKYLLLVLVVCLVGIITIIAMGIMIAIIGLLWKQTHAIAGVLTISFEFLAGAYAPINDYPFIIKYIAYLLPYTWGYDLVRYYLFEEKWDTIYDVWIEWAIFISMAIVYTIVSIILLKKFEKRVKKKGLNLI